MAQACCGVDLTGGELEIHAATQQISAGAVCCGARCWCGIRCAAVRCWGDAVLVLLPVQCSAVDSRLQSRYGAQ